MLALKGYTLLEKLYQGPSIEAYRALRVEDNRKVILKSIASDHPTDKELTSLQHEYNLLQKLDLPYVIHADELIHHQNSLALVLEDIDGITLAQFMNGRPMDLNIFFKIALQLIDIIESLHKNHIIHKDINPHNIIIDPHSLSIKLIDLSVSAEIFEKVDAQSSPYILEGNIAYVSPEQTGRMNRTLDYRTDFYSLGITFFQMLTGEYPFKAYDPVEWVHCHIAKVPVLASSANPDVPEMLALIIAKLLEKNPEDRYSSTSSLRLDINQCMQSYEQTGEIQPFPLRQRVSSSHLYVSQKLYGRHDQVESLLSAFERVTHGNSELLLISGYSGIGKTSLIQEIHKPVVRQYGYFISGKFDPLTRSMPYNAIIQACKSLIKQLLTEPDVRLSALKDEILSVLGINGRIIIDILPELEFIIGPQPSVVELQPSEAQNRFTMVFEDFLGIFTKSEHPLVLFLDDLQWADDSSLQLIEHILTDVKSHYLLLIGAYRDNEVKADHPLLKTIQSIKEVGLLTRTMNLTNLQLTDVEQLISDTLKQDIIEIQSLAKLIFNKTQGNPFFINQMLKLLYQEELLFFDYKKNNWQWDINKIENLGVTDNVVDLTISRLQRLPVATQETLKLAACIGSPFDLQTLAIISQQSLISLTQNLMPAIEEGLIKNLGSNYKQAGFVGENNRKIAKIEYQFLHDRVQQSAYDLIPEKIRKHTHLNIGRLLLRDYSLHNNEEIIFAVLQHYDKSLDLIVDVNEKRKISELNLIAAQKAKRSIAYHYALNYVNAGLSLLDDTYWRSDYDLLFNLYRERSECAYLVGQHSDSEKYFDVLLEHAETNLVKADIYTIKVILYANRHQHEKSLTTGGDALKLLGIKLPLHPNILTILKNILYVKWRLRFKNIANLDQEMKEAEKPETIVASHVLMEMGPAAYIANPILLSLMASIRIITNLNDGYCRYSVTAYMTYALFEMTQLHNYKKTFEFTDLAGKLADRVNHLPTLSRYYATLALWFAHWRYPFSKCKEICQKAYRATIDSGDTLFAGYSQMANTELYFTSGTSLPELLKIIEIMDETLHRIQDMGFYQFGSFFKSLVHYWQGSSNLSLEDIANLVKKPELSNTKTLTMIHNEMFGFLLLTFGEYDLALKHFETAYDHRQYALALLWNQDFYPFYAITLAQCYPKASSQQKRKYKKMYKKLLAQVKEWNKQCPFNIQYKYFLMLAEWERINGNLREAAYYYDKSIETAEEEGINYFLAIANELTAKFYLSINKYKFAKLYMLDAYYNYVRWGASGKAKSIEEEYSSWFVQQKPLTEVTASTTTMTSSTIDPTMLDFISVLKATQTISGEIVLENLLREMLRIVSENAGAERGLILLENDNQLVVAAEGYENTTEVKLFSPEPVNLRNDLPLKLIAYVKNTQEVVVLNNAVADGRFMHDSYITMKQPKSILCIPIIKQKNLIGILYLENNLVQDAFKEDLLQVLHLLSTQAAISLENARLYAASDHFVPRAFLHQLNKQSLVNVKLGDSIYCEKTIMFCDIRNFTSFSEDISPNEVFRFINSFFADMEPIISQYRGFIDKYIGDAIMALFDNPDSAIQAAIAMKRQLMNVNQVKINDFAIDIGIGLNTGEVILGIVGNATRMEGTVMGNAVNVASRIQDLTKQYSVPLLITDETEKKLMYPKHYALRLIDEVIVRGQKNPIPIYEVCAADVPLVRNHKMLCLDQFQAAREQYKLKNYKKAAELFRQCLRPDIVDHVVNLYLAKCETILKNKSFL